MSGKPRNQKSQVQARKTRAFLPFAQGCLANSVFEERGTVLLFEVLTRWPVDLGNVLRSKRDELSRVKVQAFRESWITLEYANVVTASSFLHNDPQSIDAAISDLGPVPGFKIEEQFGSIAAHERFTRLAGWDVKSVRVLRVSVFG